MSAADRCMINKQTPPLPRATVDPASYTGKPESAIRDERDALLVKKRIARARLEQVIACLIKDARGNPREPSLNEREAREVLELLHQIYEELAR